MLRPVLWRSQLSGLMLALAAGVVALSCAGGSDRQTVSGPAPVAVQPTTTSDDGGSVGEAALPGPQPICHYDAATGTVRNMTVTAAAVPGHLSHGDAMGRCADVVCPCFNAADMTLECSGGSRPGCDLQNDMPYTLTLDCDQGNVPGVYWHVDKYLASNVKQVCWTTKNLPIQVLPVTPTVAAACKQLIVSHPLYPATCPR